MTREEAIDVLKHNYPSACFTDLCEAVEIAIQAIQEQPTIEPPNKALYRFYNDGQYVKILLLTDDQAAVFYWLENLGVPIILEPDDVREPEEIRPEDLMKMEDD